MKKNLFVNIFFLFISITGFSQITVVPFSGGFTQPLDIKNCGDGRLFVVERAGYIKIVDSVGVHRPGYFLDIHTIVETAYGERGLLGMAFPPDYQTSGYFYCYYTQKTTGRIRVSRFSVSATNPDSAVASSEQVMMDIYHRYSNHNGGGIAFGPDGYLYFGTGDGGSGNDPQNRAQNLDSLMGKMIRIDVSGSGPYTIPASNPFVGIGGRDEIWAYGLRNPWRWSFDSWNGDLWIGDVGQDAWEEIDYQPASSHGGENYGWRCYEGLVNTSGITPACSPPNATFPVRVVSQSTGAIAMMGGYVYRGSKYKNMFGKYFYTDEAGFAFGIHTLSHVGTAFYDSLAVPPRNHIITTMGVDKWGELYFNRYSEPAVAGADSIFRFQGAPCSPVAFISDLDTMFICGASSAVLQTPAGEGYHYSWLWSGGPVTGDTSAITITQDGNYSVTVVDQAVCMTVSRTVHVSFVPVQPVSFTGLDTLYCVYDAQVALTPNVPGGTFFGAGITGANFNPSLVDPGTYAISYEYTDAHRCVGTDSQNVRIDICAGVIENSFVNVSLFPNPNTGSFSLGFYMQKDELLHVEITDVLGQVVYMEDMHVNGGSHRLNLDLPGVTPGVYFLKVSDTTGSVVKNFVVN